MAVLTICRYLSSDPNVMNNIYDSEGFYKTGDVGRLENNRVFVLGRASHDGDSIHSILIIECILTWTSHPLPRLEDLRP